MLEQGSDFWCWFDTTQFSYIPLCSPNTCKYVFNPNVTTFQSNCAEGLHFSAFIIVVHVVKHQSVLIIMQKAVEPENDAGFPKHNYSQLNCSCYSYPSKPIYRLQYF